MPKMSTKTNPLRLEGATMGTRWSVLLDGPAPPDLTPLKAALQAAVQEVDTQMSTWTPQSDLMRFNAAPLNTWHALPSHLMRVLAAGLAISKMTDAAFEMNVGDAVTAWGFGPSAIDLAAIQTASASGRVRAMDALHLDEPRLLAKKTAPLALDLSGIAKGYGVDRLAEVLADWGLKSALCTIDGEVRALGSRSNGSPWAVAIQSPETGKPSAHSMLDLAQAAVATSGDYRHFVTVKGHRLSHTIDPRRAAPLLGAPASVSVLAASCAQADALATALMVMGQEAGLALARRHGFSALFILRRGDALTAMGCGHFAA